MNKRTNSGNTKPRTYSGVIKSQQNKMIAGRVYMRENVSTQKQGIWSLAVIILLLGPAAALIPFATGYIDPNNLSITAAGMEWYYVGFSVLGLTVIGFALDEIYRGRKS